MPAVPCSVSIDQTMFASELRFHAGPDLPLVSITWDDHGRVRVALPDRVWVRVDADWLARNGANAPRLLAGLLEHDWRLHLERAS